MSEKDQGWRELTDLFKIVKDKNVIEISLNSEYITPALEHMTQHYSAKHQNPVGIYVPRAY